MKVLECHKGGAVKLLLHSLRGQKGQSELNLSGLEAGFDLSQRANFEGVLALKIKGNTAFQPNQGLMQNVPPN